MKTFFHDGICPVRDILDRIGSKWSLLIISTLSANGVMRFNEIQHTLGDISQRMLTVTLRDLEKDGMISREIYPQVPPKVEYKLTSRGESFIPILSQLIEWSLTNCQQIIQDRSKIS